MDLLIRTVHLPKLDSKHVETIKLCQWLSMYINLSFQDNVGRFPLLFSPPQLAALSVFLSANTDWLYNLYVLKMLLYRRQYVIVERWNRGRNWLLPQRAAVRCSLACPMFQVVSSLIQPFKDLSGLWGTLRNHLACPIQKSLGAYNHHKSNIQLWQALAGKMLRPGSGSQHGTPINSCWKKTRQEKYADRVGCWPAVYSDAFDCWPEAKCKREHSRRKRWPWWS